MEEAIAKILTESKEFKAEIQKQRAIGWRSGAMDVIRVVVAALGGFVALSGGCTCNHGKPNREEVVNYFERLFLIARCLGFSDEEIRSEIQKNYEMVLLRKKAIV